MNLEVTQAFDDGFFAGLAHAKRLGRHALCQGAVRPAIRSPAGHVAHEERPHRGAASTASTGARISSMRPWRLPWRRFFGRSI